jgi:T4-like virus Myoviridae tail sheath stabiliser
MLEHFYHGLTKKYIAAFGSLFNDITLVKYNNARTDEMKRTKVPIFFAPREKWYVAKEEGGRKVQTTLPLMSYNMSGLSFDALRKLNALHRHPKANTVSGNADSVYNGIPYDITFELFILARNKDDIYQIVEQILPSFQPSYTFSQILIPELGFVKDIPVTLNSVDISTNYEADFDEVATVECTMQFTMKVYYYGPVTYTKIIRRAFANTFLDPALYSGAIIRVNVNNGNNGVFKLEDIVYQGQHLSDVRAAGVVTKWVHTANANSGYLIIGGVQGNFSVNTDIKAATTNAVYNLESFDMTPLKVVSQKVEPDPIDAEPTDAWGYSETLTEYPDTIE